LSPTGEARSIRAFAIPEHTPLSSAPAATAARQIVICCDGTNNTLTAGTQDTNVLKLHAHLAAHPSPQRVLYYDPGVGTPDLAPPTGVFDWLHRSTRRMAGLASGRGVYDNIAQAYLFVMREWRGPQDRIYAFGFSRGAFTVRCVVGMINLFGVLSPEYEALLPTLVHIYFSLPERRGTHLQEATRAVHHAIARHGKAAAEAPGLSAPAAEVTRDTLAQQVRALFTTPEGREAWVHWVGVWDTVESVGLPGPLARSNPSTATLHGKRIRHVRHALALDEHRWTFVPRLYEEPGDIADAATGQTLKQRWFPGVHCDVGGSYAAWESGLSNAALAWMLDEVHRDLGVPAWAGPASERLRHDALWVTPWWALAGMVVRDMRPRTATGEPIATIAQEAEPGASQVLPSIWARRRPLWPVAVALLLGGLCLLLSGACLRPEGWHVLGMPGGLQAASDAAREFALEQLGALRLQGVLLPGHAPWEGARQAGWAMAWDFGFIACWGYLLARVTSRGFAWLVGRRSVSSGLPAWRWLGMAPMAAVLGDVAEDTGTWAALALHAAGVDLLAQVALWFGSWGSIEKFAGLAACVPWLLLRVWIALPGVGRARY
jgi:uncharacterized protein (DUF2235 family)